MRLLRTPDDLDPIVERIGDARYVLLGEASHGTHEYYAWRAELSKRLIEEQGFDLVVVEGDWPDCWEINAWVRGLDGDERSAREMLERFDRWPTWMWANREVEKFITWLRDRNAGRAAAERAGFYGFDVYSLWESMREILDYLTEHEPGAVDAALEAMQCFEPYGEDPQSYAMATRMVPTSCEEEVVELLARICRERPDPPGADPEARFAAEQNAAVAREAERYYRAMVRGGGWNVRDTHMVDTLDRLVDHHGPGSRAIVWAHNTHVGDARATDMSDDGLVNVGQLVRERHADEGVVVVGFAGHRGTVIAASAWGAPPERMAVPAGRAGSVEDLLHAEVGEDAVLVFDGDAPDWSREPRTHRAIGVVYAGAMERYGNYVPSVMAERYDALCYLEETRALEPLGPEPAAPGEEAETYPSGV